METTTSQPSNKDPQIVKGNLLREALHQARNLQAEYNYHPERIYVSAEGEKRLQRELELFGIGTSYGYQSESPSIGPSFCGIRIQIIDGMPDGHFLMISREAIERVSREARIVLELRAGLYLPRSGRGYGVDAGIDGEG